MSSPEQSLAPPHVHSRLAPHPRAEAGSLPSDVHWLNLIFLAAIHLLSFGGLIAFYGVHGFTFVPIVLCCISVGVTTFVVSAGYHRLFAHRTYEAGTLFRLIMLIVGAAAFQNSALEWASQHRRHHRFVDTPRDPYDATRGLWYSHIGWVVERGLVDPIDVPDLDADPLVRWQHRYYVPIGLVVGFAVPCFAGWLMGNAWAGLLFGGFLRLVVSYHMIFAINSLAHWMGTQPYSRTGTARDSWFAGLLTMGEGYHNYHHTFPGDYRNGVRYYDIDLPKWVINVCARVGLVKDLKRTPGHLIALRRLRTDREQLDNGNYSSAQRKLLEEGAEALRASLRAWSGALAAQNTLAAADGTIEPSSRVIGANVIRSQRLDYWRRYRQWRMQVRTAQPS